MLPILPVSTSNALMISSFFTLLLETALLMGLVKFLLTPTLKAHPCLLSKTSWQLLRPPSLVHLTRLTMVSQVYGIDVARLSQRHSLAPLCCFLSSQSPFASLLGQSTQTLERAGSPMRLIQNTVRFSMTFGARMFRLRCMRSGTT